jgi:hypothetical protein
MVTILRYYNNMQISGCQQLQSNLNCLTFTCASTLAFNSKQMHCKIKFQKIDFYKLGRVIQNLRNASMFHCSSGILELARC